MASTHGKTAVPINEEVQKKALKRLSPWRDSDHLSSGRGYRTRTRESQEIGDLAKDMDDLVLYAIYPVTVRSSLSGNGVTPAPPEVKPLTLDEVKKRDELIAKAKLANWLSQLPSGENRQRPHLQRLC